MRILAIDTSNQTLTIGVCEDQKILGEYTTNVKKNHSVTLMPAIDELMKAIGLKPADIDRFVVAQGPGSYTGLRIGVTTAKTMAYTLKKDLVGVSSLAVIAANCMHESGWIVPVMDARRGNVYTGAYQYEDGQLVQKLPDRHISMGDWLEQLADQEAVYFVGETTNFIEQIERFPNAAVNRIPQWDIPGGVVLAQLGAKAAPADLETFLPHYLKRVEAEEKWLAQNHEPEAQDYVEKI